MTEDGLPGEGMTFGSLGEIEHALQNGLVKLHSKVKARVAYYHEDGSQYFKVVETSPGRMLLGQLLPAHHKVPYDIMNRLQTKKDVSAVIDQVYRHCGQKNTVIFCDRLMGLGFKHAAMAGISFGKDDMVIPDTKQSFIDGAEQKVREFEQQYMDGLITRGEKYNKVIDVWSHMHR
jgi:DNA-directed RNA polymerase subunit beta'